MKCSNVPHLAMKATYGFIKVSTGFVRFLLENCGKTIDHVGVDREIGWLKFFSAEPLLYGTIILASRRSEATIYEPFSNFRFAELFEVIREAHSLISRVLFMNRFSSHKTTP